MSFAWQPPVGQTPVPAEGPLKAQGIRLFDVGVIGPLMIFGGVITTKEAPTAGGLLVLFGIGTIFYNANNYMILRAQKLREAA